MPSDTKPHHSTDGDARSLEDEEMILDHLARRTLDQTFISIGELRDLLRRAAALLCRSKRDHCAVLQHLVELPFKIFTKPAIKLGISLWLGVMNERPSMESRILALVAEELEKTMNLRKGIFSPKLQ